MEDTSHVRTSHHHRPRQHTQHEGLAAMSIATDEAGKAEESVLKHELNGTSKNASSKYERAAALMRKFPDTWVCLSKVKDKHTARSYVWQLQHDSSPALPASEFGFRIHEVNDEWWVQAIYIGEEL